MIKASLILCVFALAGVTLTQQPVSKAADCLKKLVVKSHFAGETLPQFGAQEMASFNKAIKLFSNLDTITQGKIAACNPNLASAMKKCEGIYGAGNCQKLNAISVGQKCQKGYVRGHDENCTIACPPGYTERGTYCEKPKAYVNRPFSTLADCQTKTGTTCTIWHVRYYASVCKPNYEKLGATVCIGKCPYGTEDHDSFCYKKLKENGGRRLNYSLADN